MADDSNYKVCELCVDAKFANFKEEILNYRHVTVTQYQKIMVKAKELIKTKNVKKIKAKDQFTPIYYEIATDTLLCIWNLIAIILYTDYSAHCSEFSASFRRLSPFEPLEVTKKRNAMFWWMAKTLRETVELFGQCRHGNSWWNEETKEFEDLFKGPFYSGVNKPMIIPSFNIRLNAPTSTARFC